MYTYEYPKVDTPYPLGRHVEHDPRSLNFAFPVSAPTAPLRTILHRSYGLPLNQGNLGSCTGNAMAGAKNSLPLHKTGERILKEPDAVDLYSLATSLDAFSGAYPPTDTGSSGLAVAKAAKQKGLIKSYWHAFSIEQALAALQIRAVITGLPWYERMFDPTPDGFVRIGGEIAGGHEFLVRGFVKARRNYVLCMNSWGPEWGTFGGAFKMFVEDWIKLMYQDGDVTVFGG